MFSSLVLIVFISNFFLGPFITVIILLNFTLQTKILFLFFMLIVTLILLIFRPFTKLIFLFNFALQSNIKLILIAGLTRYLKLTRF